MTSEDACERFDASVVESVVDQSDLGITFLQKCILFLAIHHQRDKLAQLEFAVRQRILDQFRLSSDRKPPRVYVIRASVCVDEIIHLM